MRINTEDVTWEFVRTEPGIMVKYIEIWGDIE